MLKFLALFYMVMATTMAFIPAANRRPASSLSMALMTPPPPVNHVVMDTAATTKPSSLLNQGVDAFLQNSPSQLLALQERKPPTPEEIAAKKRNFNLWFWGGGIVAPFLATFYYFGLKFWEK